MMMSIATYIKRNSLASPVRKQGLLEQFEFAFNDHVQCIFYEVMQETVPFISANMSNQEFCAAHMMI